MTGMHRPINATMLNAIRVIVLLIPLSYAGAYYGGIRGIFFGRLITDLTVGTIGLIWISRVIHATLAEEKATARPIRDPA
jgi:Na+-driven multidrug efflux pump